MGRESLKVLDTFGAHHNVMAKLRTYRSHFTYLCLTFGSPSYVITHNCFQLMPYFSNIKTTSKAKEKIVSG